MRSPRTTRSACLFVAHGMLVALVACEPRSIDAIVALGAVFFAIIEIEKQIRLGLRMRSPHEFIASKSPNQAKYSV